MSATVPTPNKDVVILDPSKDTNKDPSKEKADITQPDKHGRNLIQTIRQLIAWVNDDGALQKYIEDRKPQEASRYPHVVQAIWARLYFAKKKVTLVMLDELLSKPNGREKEISDLIEIVIGFFKEYGKRIEKTDLDYNLNNRFPLNRYCIEAADCISKFQAIPRYKLLFPKLAHVDLVVTQDTADKLALHQFIMDDDGKNIITANEVFSNFKTRNYLAYQRQSDSKTLEERITFLSEREKQRLLAQSKATRRYYDAILRRQTVEKQLATAKTWSANDAVEQLANGLKRGSTEGSGREGEAGAESAVAVQEFHSFYLRLSDAERKQVADCRAENLLYISNIGQALEMLFNPQNNTHNRVCNYNLSNELALIRCINSELLYSIIPNNDDFARELSKDSQNARKEEEESKLYFDVEQSKPHLELDGGIVQVAESAFEFKQEDDDKETTEVVFIELCRFVKRNICSPKVLGQAHPFIASIFESTERFDKAATVLDLSDIKTLLMVYQVKTARDLLNLERIDAQKKLLDTFKVGELDHLILHGDVLFGARLGDVFFWKLIRLTSIPGLVKLLENQAEFRKYLSLVPQHDSKQEQLKAFLKEIGERELINLLSGTNKGVYEEIIREVLLPLFLARISPEAFTKIFINVMKNEAIQGTVFVGNGFAQFIQHFLKSNPNYFSDLAKNNEMVFLQFVCVALINGVSFDAKSCFELLATVVVANEKAFKEFLQTQILSKQKGTQDFLLLLMKCFEKCPTLTSLIDILSDCGSTITVPLDRSTLAGLIQIYSINHKKPFAPKGFTYKRENLGDLLVMLIDIAKHAKVLPVGVVIQWNSVLTQDVLPSDQATLEEELEKLPFTFDPTAAAVIQELRAKTKDMKVHAEGVKLSEGVKLTAFEIHKTLVSFSYSEDKELKEKIDTLGKNEAEVEIIANQIAWLFEGKLELCFQKCQNYVADKTSYNRSELYRSFSEFLNYIAMFECFLGKCQNLPAKIKFSHYSDDLKDIKDVFDTINRQVDELFKFAIEQDLHKAKMIDLQQRWNLIIKALKHKIPDVDPTPKRVVCLN